jgi:pyridoxine 4-dehydrogenase
MTILDTAGTFQLGDRKVKRLGYGAMQLAGPGVFGPPKDREAAIAVLREAVAAGVDHIDTSDFYGPHVVNQIIREALHPYPDDLVLVSKVGAVRGADASWLPALEPEDLIAGVHDNLRNLGIEAIDIVKLRIGGLDGPTDGPIARQFETLAQLQRQGLVRHLGLSNVTSSQLARRARSRRWSACRTITTSSTAPTTIWSTNWRR